MRGFQRPTPYTWRHVLPGWCIPVPAPCALSRTTWRLSLALSCVKGKKFVTKFQILNEWALYIQERDNAHSKKVTGAMMPGRALPALPGPLLRRSLRSNRRFGPGSLLTSCRKACRPRSFQRGALQPGPVFNRPHRCALRPHSSRPRLSAPLWVR